jgi:hypothetical protein
MFPIAGSQIFTKPGSPEDFHFMEVKNGSRDASRCRLFLEMQAASGGGPGAGRIELCRALPEEASGAPTFVSTSWACVKKFAGKNVGAPK